MSVSRANSNKISNQKQHTQILLVLTTLKEKKIKLGKSHLPQPVEMKVLSGTQEDRKKDENRKKSKKKQREWKKKYENRINLKWLL